MHILIVEWWLAVDFAAGPNRKRIRDSLDAFEDIGYNKFILPDNRRRVSDDPILLELVVILLELFNVFVNQWIFMKITWDMIKEGLFLITMVLPIF